jgi:hypothetical protein
MSISGFMKQRAVQVASLGPAIALYLRAFF